MVRRAADGSALRMVGANWDITPRKQAEAALHEAEARLRLSVAASNIGLWDWNLARNTVVFSREWKSQLGYAEDEIADRFGEWESRVHPADLAPTQAKLQRFIADPAGQYATEFRLRHKDGSYRWIFTQAQLFRDAAGQPARMVGCHIDITERKRAEEALRENEQRLRSILDTMFVFVGLLNLAGEIVEVNQAPLLAAGLPRAAVLGQNVAESYWFAHSPAVQEQVRRALARAAHGEIIREDFPIRIAGDQRLTIDTTFAPLRDRAVAASELADATIATVQKIAAELRPGALDNLGLEAALHQKARGFQERTGLSCVLVAAAACPELPPAIANELFYICQEALTNVARHAHATHVEIHLRTEGDAMVLEVRADGVGMAAAGLHAPRSLGLIGMRERAGQCGGTVAFQRNEPQGTRVTVRVPCANEPAVSAKGAASFQPGATPQVADRPGDKG